MNASLRVIVADDQRSVRDGLVALLTTLPDIDVVGAAADGAEAVARVAELTPDAVLMDLRMPGTDGVQATAHLTRHHPTVAVVVLTTFADDESVLAALAAGARGYLTKNAGRADLARALHTAAAGQVTLAAPVQQKLLAAATRNLPATADLTGLSSAGLTDRTGLSCAGLTDREGELLALIVEGLNNREIAQRLHIGTATVKTHVNHIFTKLGVTTRPAAMVKARLLMRW